MSPCKHRSVSIAIILIHLLGVLGVFPFSFFFSPDNFSHDKIPRFILFLFSSFYLFFFFSFFPLLSCRAINVSNFHQDLSFFLPFKSVKNILNISIVLLINYILVFYIYASIYLCIYTYTYVCIYTRIHIYTYMYAYMYIYNCHYIIYYALSHILQRRWRIISNILLFCYFVVVVVVVLVVVVVFFFSLFSHNKGDFKQHNNFTANE